MCRYAEGLDSLGALELANHLSNVYSVSLPSTLAFDYPTVDAIIAHVVTATVVGGGGGGGGNGSGGGGGNGGGGFGGGGGGGGPSAGGQRGHHRDSPVGAEGATAGDVLLANSMAALDLAVPVVYVGAAAGKHSSLSAADVVSTVPVTRWDVDVSAAADGFVKPRFGCFVGDVDMFDAAAFSVHDAEAASMDPQHRLLAESAAETLLPIMVRRRLQAAELTSTNSSGDVGIYVGMVSSSFASLFPEAAGAYSATGQQPSAASGRLSYTFGCNGPAVTIDTACSSSLVAVHHAMSHIRLCSGGGGVDVETAMCGGVHVMLSPHQSRLCQLAGMLSGDGRCKALDAAADGYVRGEAAETVAASTAMETCAYGGGAGGAGIVVLEGAAVNQDGRSGSLTAPHGPSQQAVIGHALASVAGCFSFSHVSQLQLHGTGTSLGDPIEINAASVALGVNVAAHVAQRHSPLVLSAVKTRVGHGEPAAGITALIAAMSQISGDLSTAPVLHLRALNPHITAVQLGSSDGGSNGCYIPR